MLLIRIRNDGSGSIVRGNYDCEVLIISKQNQKTLMTGRIENFDRTQGWQALINRVNLLVHLQPEIRFFEEGNNEDRPL